MIWSHLPPRIVTCTRPRKDVEVHRRHCCISSPNKVSLKVQLRNFSKVYCLVLRKTIVASYCKFKSTIWHACRPRRMIRHIVCSWAAGTPNIAWPNCNIKLLISSTTSFVLDIHRRLPMSAGPQCRPPLRRILKRPCSSRFTKRNKCVPVKRRFYCAVVVTSLHSETRQLRKSQKVTPVFIAKKCL